jgi:6-phosphogluconolactonase (cycloisomerase 2 family)
LKFLEFLGGKLWAAGNSGIVQLNTSPSAVTLSTSFVLDRSAGYRAAAIHNSSNFFYAIDQSDAVHVFCLKESCERGEQAQLPVPSPDGATSIAIQSDFAYVTHANSADVAAFSINAESGALALIASFPAGAGATSARVFLSKFLYVANSGDGTVSGYLIDPKTGLLSSIPGSPFQTGENPVSIVAP